MTTKNHSKILFLDFNGVLSYDHFWHTLTDPNHKLHEYHAKIHDYLFEENRDMLRQWMLGKYTTEDIHHTLHEKTGVPYQELLDIFEQECRNIDISKPILDLIKSLKSQYYCILATGNMDCFDRFTLPSNPILEQTFDEINNSYNLGIFKSTDGGRYFKEKTETLGGDIKSSVVIDDSDGVCEAFTKLGGRAFCVTGESEVIKVLQSLL
jgi:2-hydroxy-3-keto-5-methylthiopentenyl-1-phosphate phosphatase